MKKFVLSLVAAMLCMVSAAYGAIYTYDYSEDVMNGVRLRHIQRFYGDGWHNINAVIADLTDPAIKLELLKGKNVDSLTSMASLVNDSVVAAANADFFDNTRPAYSQGFSLGIEYKDGELLQSQIDESMAAGFYDGQSLNFSYMSMSITLTAPSGETRRVAHLNKHTDYYGDILMYTSDWNNGWSPAPGGDVAEMVVENGIVTEIRRNQPAAQIPENGYVLAVSEGTDGFFNNYCEGMEMNLSISVDPSLEGIDTAFGGGTLLLKDGKKTKITHNIAGSQPRTCIGTNAEGTVVYIITVDGRQAASKGATMSELADIALELGCVNAMNLDGGGSTRMLARSFWNDNALGVVNLPTENRKVINAVAVTTDAAPGPAVGIKLRADSEAVLVGDVFPLELKFYDANGLAVSADGQSAAYSVAGAEGGFSGGSFMPQTPGDAVITASCPTDGGAGQAVSDPVTVHVIGEVANIDIDEEIRLDVGQSLWLTPSVSGGGFTAPVRNPDLLYPTVGDVSVASYGGGMLTGVSPGRTLLTLSRDSAAAYCLVTVGEPGGEEPSLPHEAFADPAEGSFDTDDSFGVFAFNGPKNNLLDNLLYNRGLEAITGLNSGGFLGQYTGGETSPVTAGAFTVAEMGGALVISLPENGRLSAAEWLNMTSAVSSSPAGTIIILSNSAPSGAIDIETQVFYDYFNSLDKAVYLVMPGRANGLSYRGKMRTLTLADVSDYPDIPSAVEDSWVLRFTFADGEYKFRFEKLF